MTKHDKQPGLADFLARHSKLYEPTTDDYERPPFGSDIKEGKNDPIYNAHSYHTKVPPRSIIPYILHYTHPGDLVLDLFCGSGMTGVAAQMCARPPDDILAQFPELKDRVGPRACILNDLSPAACHIALNYNKPIEIAALRREFERIKTAVKDEFDTLYGTEHYEPAVGPYDPANVDVASRLSNPPAGITQTLLGGEERNWELLTKADVEARLGYPVSELPRDDNWENLDVAKINQWVCIPATLQYTIWSDVYPCEGLTKVQEPTGKTSKRGKNVGKPTYITKRVQRGCGKDIVLWDAAIDPVTKDFVEAFACPHCNQQWNKLNLRLKTTIPVWVSYSVNALRKTASRRGRRVAVIDRQKSQQIEERDPHPRFPNVLLDAGRELMTMGPANRGMTRLADFYTPRNQWALGRLWEYVNARDDACQRTLRFAFTAILDVASRRNRFPQQSVMSGTLYVPSIQIEMNVFSQFERRVDKIVKASAASALRQFHATDVLVWNGDARDLSWIPTNSVDYVFTDPPFGGNIFYADASILMEAWLGASTDETKELVFNRQRRQDQNFKTLSDYSAGMAMVFREVHRVLKPGRWCTVEFNNSDGAVFDGIKTAVLSAGFEISNMLLLDKAQKSFKQVKGASGEEDVVDKDVLFNLHKPAIVHAEARPEDVDLEKQLVSAVRQHLQTLPERMNVDPTKYNDEHRTTATINSMLMNALIPRGVSVERLNLPFIERICSRYFRKVGQRWYLRGEAAGGNGGGGLVQEEFLIKDELTAIAWMRYKLEKSPMLIGEIKPLWMQGTGLLPAAIANSLVLDNLLSENFWRDPDTNRWRDPTPEERERMNDDRSLRVLHDAERYANGTLNRATTDDERSKWIDVLFQACRAVEDNETDALPALRDFDKAEAYLLVTRLFQSILRDNVSAQAYARAEKQARAASLRIQKEAEQKQEAAQKDRPEADQGVLDFKD